MLGREITDISSSSFSHCPFFVSLCLVLSFVILSLVWSSGIGLLTHCSGVLCVAVSKEDDKSFADALQGNPARYQLYV